MSQTLLYQSEVGRTKLEGFLNLNDRDILTHAGKISTDAAKSHAEVEFSEFRKAEDLRLKSNFDRALKNLSPPPRCWVARPQKKAQTLTA